MTTIKTPFNNQMVKVKLEPGESLVIEFQPDGANAAPLSKSVSFTVDSIFFPNGRVGLGIRFQSESLYQSGSTFVILDDPNGASKLEINGIELERVDQDQERIEGPL